MIPLPSPRVESCFEVMFSVDPARRRPYGRRLWFRHFAYVANAPLATATGAACAARPDVQALVGGRAKRGRSTVHRCTGRAEKREEESHSRYTHHGGTFRQRFRQSLRCESRNVAKTR